MRWRGIIITGTSGAGKSTITDMLRDRHPEFEQVRAVTTRNPREGDEPGIYEHHTLEGFEQLRGDLIIWAEYRGNFYGITKASLEQVEERGKVPILVITPRSLAEFQSKYTDGVPFLTIFLDAPDEVLDARLHVRDGTERRASLEKQRVKDREFICGNYIMNNSLSQTFSQVFNLWRVGFG